MVLRERGGAEGEKMVSSILRDTAYQYSDPPKTGRGIAELLGVARELASVDPEASIRLVEPVVAELNDYTDAFEADSLFRRRLAWRKGEFVFFTGFYSTGAYLFKMGNFVEALDKANDGRVKEFISLFDRPEIRVFFKVRHIGRLPNGLRADIGSSEPSL